MDQSFWQTRWQRGEIGFHQPHIHAQLQAFWPGLGLAKGSAVFVPLAGKSRDMAWLAGQGHEVIGAELSELAVRDFFEESGLSPTVTRSGPFQVFEAGPFKIYQGDFFALPPDTLSGVAACYDRAATIALPPEMRPRYAEKLASVLPSEAQILLIAIDYPEGEIKGPPFAVPQSEIRELYAPLFDIDVLEDRDGLAESDNLKKRGVTRLEETAYLLRRRA
ncbi:thiopurine S-methyltransferase [Hyphomicrobium sp.]|jgi:thiopurine S-methyltransferase|uniref:thiopurine S-methyltransferase n=1 Tax=Hyphomicrobium sp. TaxID=82 RepID=UPI00356A5A08